MLKIVFLSLKESEQTIAELRQLLSADEVARADKFVFPRDSNRFIVARARLRQILADEIGCTTQELDFTYSKHGKPSLVGHQLEFNLSHSEDYALYAIHPTAQVGIDIESKQRDLEFDSMAQRFFSANESKLIKSLSGTEQRQAFYSCWTRKEALLKAIGKGLSFPLKDCEVVIAADETPRVIAIAGSENDPNEWSLYNLELLPDFAAAVAIKTNDTEYTIEDLRNLA